MSKILLTGSLVAILVTPACSEPTTSEQSAAATETAVVPAETRDAAKGVIPQAQLDAMAKAAATGSVLEKAEQERRKQMEAQGL